MARHKARSAIHLTDGSVLRTPTPLETLNASMDAQRGILSVNHLTGHGQLREATVLLASILYLERLVDKPQTYDAPMTTEEKVRRRYRPEAHRILGPFTR